MVVVRSHYMRVHRSIVESLIVVQVSLLLRLHGSEMVMTRMRTDQDSQNILISLVSLLALNRMSTSWTPEQFTLIVILMLL